MEHLNAFPQIPSCHFRGESIRPLGVGVFVGVLEKVLRLAQLFFKRKMRSYATMRILEPVL